MKTLVNIENSSKGLAPIVLFTYNRISHLRKTIESLGDNDLAKESEIFIFSDGFKNEYDKNDVLEVRKYLKELVQQDIFKKVMLIFADENRGLAKNIIMGVSRVIKQYHRVIVIEDDVVTSKDFLTFMNEALDFYEKESRVWSIGGYTHPMKLKEIYDKDVYAVQRCSSYCWGTWEEQWNKIDWDIKDYREFRYNFIKRYKFNRSGNDMAAMLDAQMAGRINSWAIRFDYNMWKNDRINILPVCSKANNIGHDGSGTHANIDLSQNDKFSCEIEKRDYILEVIDINENVVKEYRKIFHCSLWMLLKNYVKNLKLV